jgi:hypothetical protein
MLTLKSGAAFVTLFALLYGWFEIHTKVNAGSVPEWFFGSIAADGSECGALRGAS